MPIHGMRLMVVALFVLLSAWSAQANYAQAPEPYSYISFDGQQLTLYPYTGQHIALLVPSSSLDTPTLTKLVITLDTVYDYYHEATGRTPSLYRNYNGLATIAVVPTTCGAGCGYLGATGIELQSTTFDILYNGVLTDNVYDQAIFYEFGRNFWFYSDQAEYKGSDNTGSITTGYAVFMRFMAMEATGVTPGLFNGNDFAVFKAEVEGLLDRYLTDPTLTWENTLRIGQAPANPLGLGATDLFASFLFELRARYGTGFVGRLWPALDTRPSAQTTQQAVDNLIIASSIAANENLSSLFTDTWRWPLSSDARAELSRLFPTVTSTTTNTHTTTSTRTASSTRTTTVTKTPTPSMTSTHTTTSLSTPAGTQTSSQTETPSPSTTPTPTSSNASDQTSTATASSTQTPSATTTLVASPQAIQEYRVLLPVISTGNR